MSHMTEQIGRVVGGRYRLLAPLGSGASAEVYLADDVRLHRRVAVKLLRAGLADDEAFLRRFRTEARSAAALSHHNIVAIFDWNGDASPPYLVSEYLGGGSLRSMLDRGVRLSPSQALVVGLEVSQALDHAHRQGFVHRDIKPENLLFGEDTRLRVADFGLARAVAEAGLTEPGGAVLGTARYASPEQVRGDTLAGRSDIYSLVLLLVEAVTGTVPFSTEAATHKSLMARLDQPVEVPDELDSLAPVLRGAGAVDPADRPDAAGLVQQLLATAPELPRPARLPIVVTDPTQRAASAEPSEANGPSATVPVTAAQGTASPFQPPPDATQRFVRPDSPSPLPMAGPQPVSPPQMPALSAKAGRRPWWNPWGVRVLAVVLALAVGAAGAWGFLQLSKPSHVVPTELVGAAEGDINRLVGDFGWHIDVTDEANTEVEEGHIIRTDPEPGRELREDETLEVFVSSGPPMVDVPGNDVLQGLPEDAVDGIFEEAGLVAEITYVPTNEVDEGEVLGVAEGTPEQLPAGETVEVMVSNGPAVTVPDVVDWRTGDARDELEGLDLEVRVERENNGEVEDGHVIRTEPQAGTDVEPGSEVVVVVSRGGGGGDDDDGEGGGDQVEVPDLSGMNRDDAAEELEDAGLELGSVIGIQDGHVQSSIPQAGDSVDEGTQVDVLMW